MEKKQLFSNLNNLYLHCFISTKNYLLMKKLSKLFTFILLILSMVSCVKKTQKADRVALIIMPQNLKYSTNVLFLQDYVQHINTIDSVTIDQKKISFYQSKRQIEFSALNYTKPLLLMQLWQQGKSTDVILKKSPKHRYLFSFNPHGIKYDSVQIAGEINAWTPSRTKLQWHDTSWQQMLFLPDGQYAYQLVADANWMLDPNNEHKVPNGKGAFNSVLTVGNTNGSKAPKLLSLSHKDKHLKLLLLNKPTQLFVLWNNQLLPIGISDIKNKKLEIRIPTAANGYKLSYLRVFSANKYGLSNDILIPLVEGNIAENSKILPREAWRTNIIYNVFIDRFYDADSSNNKPLPDSIVVYKANYQGGDIAGIINKIKSGYFKNLGVNSLWLSPVIKNTEGAYGYWPNPKTKFSSYHGYWPVSFTKMNPHFGTPNDLHLLIKRAHEQNCNILLDMVANHVHQEHPYYKKHPECATKLVLPDGSLNLERWDDHRLTTWFDKFLPTLNLERPEVAKMLADSITWWAQTYHVDGFRYDAAKHIPLSFWRRLTKELKDSIIYPQDKPLYQLGETYGSTELINSYIGNGLLNAQFDFNVYDAALSAFAGNNSLQLLKDRLQQSLKEYGYHNTMAYITGNQDKGRFISYAGGALHFDENAKKAGWTRDVEVGDTVAYNKLQMLIAFNMTIPGVPVIYYGDEFGMPGANDPDCRRMMRFGKQLNRFEKKNLAITKKLIKLRKSTMALLYGDIYSIKADSITMQYARRYFDKYAWIGFNNSSESKRFNIQLPPDINPIKLESNFGNQLVKKADSAYLIIPPYSYEILNTK